MRYELEISFPLFQPFNVPHAHQFVYDEQTEKYKMNSGKKLRTSQLSLLNVRTNFLNDFALVIEANMHYMKQLKSV